MSIERLRVTVEGISGVVTAAVTLINGLATRLREALDSENDEAIEELCSELEAKQVELAQAVALNTDSEDDSPAEPVPEPVDSIAGAQRDDEDDEDFVNSDPTAENDQTESER